MLLCCQLCYFEYNYSVINYRFEMQYGHRAQTALAYAMNSEFGRVLSAQMASFAHCSFDVTSTFTKGLPICCTSMFYILTFHCSRQFIVSIYACSGIIMHRNVNLRTRHLLQYFSYPYQHMGYFDSAFCFIDN